MKKYELLLITALCITVTVIISGCGPSTAVYQFSPDVEMKTYSGRTKENYELRGDARIMSMEPPGRPSGQIVTLSSVPEIYITMIRSRDTVLYRKSDLGRGLPSGMKCQFPAGTYTIGAGYSAPDGRSRADQYVTEDFENGKHYVLSFEDIQLGRVLWMDVEGWKLKILRPSDPKGTGGN